MAVQGRRHDDREQGRRTSDVLDAIFDRVDRPDTNESDAAERQTLFRAAALERLDVPLQVDALLPLTSRRSWLLLVGALAVVVASIGYAAATTVTESVAVTGRAVGAAGVADVSSPVAGIVTDWMVMGGAGVDSGTPVLTVQTGSGPVDVLAPIDGTLWQQLVLVGDAVEAGDLLATQLPADSGRAAVVLVSELEAGGVEPGADVRLGDFEGTVRATGPAPIPVEVAARRLAIDTALVESVLDATDSTGVVGAVIMVTVDLEAPVPPGTMITGDVVIDRSSLLSRIF